MIAIMMASKLHAAHGYLIGQFLSSKFNKRKDVYGGSFDNRAKLLIDIIDQIKEDVIILFDRMLEFSREVWPGY